ncbi:MAG TPA: aquaporin [Bryobacteraceae bacterium]|nr:aquaporin [Bryobacteraceae bacterium]
MLQALRSHWPEYLMEASALGLFMVSACTFSVLLDHPAGLLHRAISNPFVRRMLAGLAMGLTAIAIFCSPWGKRSGAHMNPSVTLSFLSLGKIHGWDAVFYIVAQFAGGIAGVQIANVFIGSMLRHSTVNYVATTPGPRGALIAFFAELVISFVMMTTVLNVSNSKRWSRFTPFVAGALVALYITVEAPFSGMSMNPARTLGSALSAQQWTALWIYFTGPPAGMFGAAQLFRFRRGLHRVFCAKLHHHNDQRCIFRCNYGELIA